MPFTHVPWSQCVPVSSWVFFCVWLGPGWVSVPVHVTELANWQPDVPQAQLTSLSFRVCFVLQVLDASWVNDVPHEPVLGDHEP